MRIIDRPTKEKTMNTGYRTDKMNILAIEREAMHRARYERSMVFHGLVDDIKNFIRSKTR